MHKLNSFTHQPLKPCASKQNPQNETCSDVIKVRTFGMLWLQKCYQIRIHEGYVTFGLVYKHDHGKRKKQQSRRLSSEFLCKISDLGAYSVTLWNSLQCFCPFILHLWNGNDAFLPCRSNVSTFRQLDRRSCRKIVREQMIFVLW